ncbi:anti-sigma factor family protein [Demetria terragena]|uniref:anti-sigma factor family protein n=1 Tax=Demetria terragena TaxID=63959 RepID=UPI000376163E|nr:zf-HC2 domain-containing protein [Demetria terragena]
MKESAPLGDADHEAMRDLLGEHALGRLNADEQAVVEEHLATCAACRSELAEFADLGPLLRQVDPDRLTAAQVDPVPELPPELEAEIGARLAGTAAVPRRPRRRRAMALTAAAALVVVGGIGGWLLAPRPPDVPFEQVAVTVPTGSAGDLDVTAGVIPHTWGMEVRMTASGFTAGAPYVVQVIDDDGKRRDAGEFVGTGDRRMVCNLNSSVLRDDAAGFVVLDQRSRTVVSSSF